jgi:DNA-binding NtrC family response regulator
METQTTQVAQAALPTGLKLVLDISALPTMEQLEQQYLTLVLAQNGGSKSKAAKILGFSVKTIYNKLDAYKANEDAKALRTDTQGS